MRRALYPLLIVAAVVLGYHVVQLTPPGSACSIIFGKGVTSAQPGAIDRLVLAVSDLDAACDELRSRGVEVRVQEIVERLPGRV